MGISLPVIPSTIRTHDNTMMSDLNYCERWYAMRHVENKRPILSKPALSFGKLLHVGLEEGYEALKEGRDPLEASISAMFDAPFEDPMGDFRTRGRALQTITDYWQQYGRDNDLEILMTETPFEVEDDEGFRWGGIIDLVTRFQNRTWAADHKSTTRFGNYYFDDYKRAPQMLGYTWAGSLLQGEGLAGVIINVIALRKDDNRFDRRPIFYAEWMIDEWRRKMIQDYHRAFEKIQKHDARGGGVAAIFDETIWTPNLHNCIGKYGKCGAYGICDTRPGLRERVFEMEFEDNKWDWTEIDD